MIRKTENPLEQTIPPVPVLFKLSVDLSIAVCVVHKMMLWVGAFTVYRENQESESFEARVEKQWKLWKEMASLRKVCRLHKFLSRERISWRK